MSNSLILPVPSVSIVNDQPATTSLAIAEHFGKQHKDVLASIRKLTSDCPEDFNERNFSPVEYTDEKGESRPMFYVFFDGFILLAMGYTGKRALQIKLAYIQAFNAMRDQLALQAEPHPRIDAQTYSLDPAFSPDRSTSKDRRPIWAAVRALSKANQKPFHLGFQALRRAFGIQKFEDLPKSRIQEALDWCEAQARYLGVAIDIDACLDENSPGSKSSHNRQRMDIQSQANSFPGMDSQLPVIVEMPEKSNPGFNFFDPPPTHVSCSTAMQLLGFKSRTRFVLYAVTFARDILALPCTVAGQLLGERDGEEWYHRDMVMLLMGKRLNPVF